MLADFCPACGLQAQPNDRFCRRCGEALGTGSVPDPIELAESLVARGQLEEAIVTVQNALGEHEAADLHVALSTLYLRRGDVDRAKNELERAIEVDPRCAIAHAYLGAVLARLGRVGEAEDYLDRAHELAPDDLVVSLKRAEWWSALGVLGRARDELRRGLQDGGGTPEARTIAVTMLAGIEERLRRSVSRSPVPLPSVTSWTKGLGRITDHPQKTPEQIPELEG